MLLLTLWLCLVKNSVKLCLNYSKMYAQSVRNEADFKKNMKVPLINKCWPRINVSFKGTLGLQGLSLK